MGVDANILIFERIREELRAGKSIKNATIAGFEKVTSTIVDANVTTLITASILIWLGTGPVKGFGITLAIGICASIFCALGGDSFPRRFPRAPSRSFQDPRPELLPDLRRSISSNSVSQHLSLLGLLVLAGVVSVAMNHDNILGKDFTGGDEITVNYTERLDTDAIMKVVEEKDLGDVTALYQTLIGEVARF